MAEKKLIDLALEFVKNEEELEEAEVMLRRHRDLVERLGISKQQLHGKLAECVGGNIKNRVFFVTKEKAVLVRWSFANGDPRINVEVIPAEYWMGE